MEFVGGEAGLERTKGSRLLTSHGTETEVSTSTPQPIDERKDFHLIIRSQRIFLNMHLKKLNRSVLPRRDTLGKTGLIATALSVLMAFAAGAQTTDSIKVAIDSSAVPKAGAFTAEQATAGSGVFSRACVECHTRKDMSSPDFRLNWSGRSAFDLFERIRSTMPDAAPGSMTVDEYLTVTAYFLKLNGMPAGPVPMPADSTLKGIKLELVAVDADTSRLASMQSRLPSSTVRRTNMPQLRTGGSYHPFSPSRKQ